MRAIIARKRSYTTPSTMKSSVRHFRLLAIAVCALAVASLLAQPAAPLDPVLVQRAGKIVEGLSLADAAKAERVRDIIARQYSDLRPIHEARDAALQAARSDEAATKRARTEAQARLSELHYAYLGRLAAELDAAQIDRVKDGMTYGVLPLTFGVYQRMMPDLTPAQKAQIYAWLTEAREFAMDGGSSDEKHGVFGRYKGRINNYLSAAGYDLKAAEKNLHAKP